MFNRSRPSSLDRGQQGIGIDILVLPRRLASCSPPCRLAHYCDSSTTPLRGLNMWPETNFLQAFGNSLELVVKLSKLPVEVPTACYLLFE